MDTFKFEKEVAVGADFDVIVCGGGPSGFAAAVSSARKGAKTLLIEKNGCTGGAWTTGLVNPIFDTEDKTGIIAELVDKLKKENAWGGFWNICYRYETLKSIMDEMLVSSGVTVLFETVVSDVITSDGTVRGVVAENRAGSTLYTAKAFVDCTGDAMISTKAGVPCFLGDENGACQSATLMFTIGNVDFKQKDANELADLIEKAVKENGLDYKLPFNHPFVIKLPGVNMCAVQLTHIYGVNPLNPFETSLAAIEGRKQAYDAFAVMKKYVPAFKDAFLIETAPFLGIRESRRIDGEACITVEDCVNGVFLEDTVCECRFNIDIHENNSDKQTNIRTVPYGIPYRALIPKGIKNLLVAGKTISGTHVAMASYRVTGDCVCMGEAAGKAAALTALHYGDVRKVPIPEIGNGEWFR